MQQLECRFYPREEIAEALSVSPKDSKHFASKVKATLEKWGYQYDYSRRGVKITETPNLPEERLREILIRELNLDVQIDAYAFACFICAFTDIDSFDSMPWEERAQWMKYKYGITVTDRTLRSWCSKLIEKNIIQKGGELTFWKTERYGKEKYRSKINPDYEEMIQYFQKRTEYIELAKEAALKAGQDEKTANSTAWAVTMKKLWTEFGGCYYTCKGLMFNAIGEDYIFEIYELAQEIAAAAWEASTDERNITTQEEYDALWYSK